MDLFKASGINFLVCGSTTRYSFRYGSGDGLDSGLGADACVSTSGNDAFNVCDAAFIGRSSPFALLKSSRAKVDESSVGGRGCDVKVVDAADTESRDVVDARLSTDGVDGPDVTAHACVAAFAAPAGGLSLVADLLELLSLPPARSVLNIPLFLFGLGVRDFFTGNSELVGLRTGVSGKGGDVSDDREMSALELILLVYEGLCGSGGGRDN